MRTYSASCGPGYLLTSWLTVGLCFGHLQMNGGGEVVLTAKVTKSLLEGGFAQQTGEEPKNLHFQPVPRVKLRGGKNALSYRHIPSPLIRPT